jgi:2-keto-3-deoxy-galactonokinase
LAEGFAIVVDIGKTLSKATLWSRDGLLLDRQVRANETRVIDGIRRLYSDAIGKWLIGALRKYSDHPVEVIVPVAHGAGLAAVLNDRLAVDPIDYEQPVPADVVAE